MFDKTDKKLYIFGGSGFNWYGKCAATNKNYKIGQRKTYYCAKRCLFGRRPYFDLKKDEILNKSEVLEDIKKGLITGFEITAVKHKD